MANRDRLASLLDRLADTLDDSAALAHQHATRLAGEQDHDAHATEEERERRAREGAQRARTQAHALRANGVGDDIEVR